MTSDTPTLDELRALSDAATPGPLSTADAAFIVAAVNYVRSLLSEDTP
jgi:hypothetical protein